MLPQMTPYTPSLYQPDSVGRYRQYPRVAETPIPGAGYHVGQLFWGEQELNLDGSARPQPYGSYSMVPLRGLGQTLHINPASLSLPAQRLKLATPPGGGDQGGPSPAEKAVEESGLDIAEQIAAAQAAAEAAQAAQAAQQSASEPGFFSKKLGPVPYWALGLGGVAVVGIGGYLVMRRRR